MRKNVNTEELAAGQQRTICEHVDVLQPDGSIAKFHCRVPGPPPFEASQISNADLLAGATIACATTDRTDVKAPGWLERIWRETVAKRQS